MTSLQKTSQSHLALHPQPKQEVGASDVDLFVMLWILRVEFNRLGVISVIIVVGAFMGLSGCALKQEIISSSQFVHCTLQREKRSRPNYKQNSRRSTRHKPRVRRGWPLGLRPSSSLRHNKWLMPLFFCRFVSFTRFVAIACFLGRL